MAAGGPQRRDSSRDIPRRASHAPSELRSIMTCVLVTVVRKARSSCDERSVRIQGPCVPSMLARAHQEEEADHEKHGAQRDDGARQRGLGQVAAPQEVSESDFTAPVQSGHARTAALCGTSRSCAACSPWWLAAPWLREGGRVAGTARAASKSAAAKHSQPTTLRLLLNRVTGGRMCSAQGVRDIGPGSAGSATCRRPAWSRSRSICCCSVQSPSCHRSPGAWGL